MTGKIVLLAAALTVAGCGTQTGGPASILDKDELVVAVKTDQPGLGFRTAGGTFEGFDVDVASYVAAHLGKKVTFVPTTSEGREDKLNSGEADMVIATFSISPQRKAEVTFAGPYYVSHQDILVRARTTDIRGVRDLRGRRLCQAKGSISASRVVEGRRVPADLVPAATYSECVDLLRAGRVDAVSTGDLILAGFAAADKGAFAIVNAPFTEERYGIALPRGDVAGCEEVNRALTAMYQSGAAARLLRERFGSTGLRLTTSVPQFEGCE
ncbi:glutamate ABC transporter substrate-binding protein [Nonomuraea endophytica]|uniref:Glutamate transport system substrate-binding protein n=1 Tax=Nonomuraea endophytica TaxID=714136 RepID=A0A7W8A8P6_9ACTN|nr:glutamate ABC transporter substrate-binding protein [Nonomuraea endophytica]MBB5081615.1 glutamate transport system substrate-binding protein [Nonomuraea endophytica]